jgi:hypothetical protein
MEQLVTEQKSLWRIKNDYPKDACEKCKSLWDKLAQQKEENVKELTELVKENL